MRIVRALLLGLGLLGGSALAAHAEDKLPCNVLCEVWLGLPSLDAPDEPDARAEPAPMPVPRYHHRYRRTYHRYIVRARRYPVRHWPKPMARRHHPGGPAPLIHPVSASPSRAAAQAPAPAIRATPPAAKPPTGDVPAAPLE